MSTPNGAGAFESVMSRTGSRSLALFLHGSSVLRTALGKCQAENTLTVAPLRGAMPMVWAADGLRGLEMPSGAEFVEAPIGIYRRVTDEGIKETSPNAGHKRRIMQRCIEEALEDGDRDPNKTHLAVLDEVQRGGTLGTASQAARKIIGVLEMRPQLQVFAAQDSRTKVSAQSKTRVYEELASNSIPNTYTTVVPMPLIASDRDHLLDTVVMSGDGNSLNGIEDRLTVIRNSDAELTFRTLGSLSRSPEVRHDPIFVEGFIQAQTFSGMEASNRVEEWMERTVVALDHLSIEH